MDKENIAINLNENSNPIIKEENSARTLKEYHVASVYKYNSSSSSKDLRIESSLLNENGLIFECICIGDANKLHLLQVSSPGSFPELKFSKIICMKNNVCALTWNSDASCLAVCDEEGNLFLYRRDGNPILSYPLIRKTIGSSKVECMKFTGFDSQQQEELIVLSNSGSLLCFRNINLRVIEQATLDKNINLSLELLKSIKMVKTSIDLSCCEHFDLEIIRNHVRTTIWVVGTIDEQESVINICSIEAKSNKIQINHKISSGVLFHPVRSVHASSNKKFVVLIGDGTISWLDATDGFLVFQWNEPTIKYALPLLCDKKDFIKISTVTRNNHLKLYECNLNCKFSEVFSMEIAPSSTISPSMTSSSVYIISLHENDFSVQACIKSTPSKQYNDLLLSRCFQEARTFAGSHGLDDTGAYGMELKAILSMLKAGKDRDVKKLYDCVEMTLRSEKDKLIDIVNMCLTSNLSSYNEMFQLILHVEKCINHIEYNGNSLWEEAINHLEKLKDRWTTFCLLSEPSGVFDSKSWNYFQGTDLVQEFAKQSNKGCVRAMMTIWRRHGCKDLESALVEALKHLPLDVPSSSLARWLRGEVIGRLSDIDYEKLAEWIYNRALKLENMRKSIKDAIILVEVLCDSFNKAHGEKQKFDLKYTLTKVIDGNYKEALVRLHDQLNVIKILKEEHDFDISLANFSRETPSTIAMAMLNRIASPDVIKDEVETHVKPFLKSFGVCTDEVLSLYVSEFREDLKKNELTELNRIASVILCISCQEIRSSTSLSFLRTLRPPYSSDIQKFATNATLLDSSRKEEIREQHRFMCLQSMFSSYGVKQFNFADQRLAKRLISHILAQIEQHPKSLNDALELVDAYRHLSRIPCIVEYIQNVIAYLHERRVMALDEENHRIQDCVRKIEDVLRIIRKEELLPVVEETTSFILFLLQEEENARACNPKIHPYLHYRYPSDSSTRNIVVRAKQDFERSLVVVLKRILTYASENLLSDSCSKTWRRHDISYPQLMLNLRRLERLQKDCEIFISLQSISSRNICETILKKLIRDLLIKKSETKKSCQDNLSKLDIQKGKGKGKSKSSGCTKSSISVTTSNSRAINIQISDKDKQDDAYITYLSLLYRIGSYLGIDRMSFNELFAVECASLGFFSEALRCGRELFDSSSYPKSLSCVLKNIALKIVEFITSQIQDSKLEQRADQYIHMSQNSNTPILLSGHNIAMELLSKALCACENLEEMDEILGYYGTIDTAVQVLKATTMHNVKHEKKIGNKRLSIYSHWNRGDTVVLPSYQALSLCTKFVIEELGRLLVSKPSDTMLQPNSFRRSKELVFFLVDNNANQLALLVLLSMHVLPEEGVGVIDKQLSILSTRVLQSVEIDHSLAFGYLLSMKQSTAFEAYRAQLSRESMYKDFSRLQKLAIVGSDVARSWEQIAFLHQCTELEGNARWWHHFSLLGIDCDHKKFQRDNRDMNYLRGLVHALLKITNLDLYLVMEFAKHYQIEESYPTLLFVQELLLNSSVSSSSTSSTNDEYKNKIVGVLQDVHPTQLRDLLMKIHSQIPSNDYERLEFLFHLLLENCSSESILSAEEKKIIEQKVAVLKILKASSISETSKKLDFHELINDPWKVLEPVISTDTVGSLVALSGPLNLDPDEFYMRLIRCMVDRYRSDYSKNCEKESSAKRRKLVETNKEKNSSKKKNINFGFLNFQPILNEMRSHESASMSAEWISQQYSLGVEQIQALSYALERMRQSLPNSNEENLDKNLATDAGKIKNTIMRLNKKIESNQTELILSKLEDLPLASSLMPLLSNPEDMLLRLYRKHTLEYLYAKHSWVKRLEQGLIFSNIPSLARNPPMTWIQDNLDFGLHVVADEIAEFHGINLDKCRISLVQEWLKEDTMPLRLNDTLGVSDDNQSDFIMLEDERRALIDYQFILRIMYICCYYKRGSTFDSIIQFLMQYMHKKASNVTYRSKLRSLNSILAIANEEKLESIYKDGGGYQGLKNLKRNYSYMMVFEENRFPQSLSQLSTCNRESLGRGLLRDFSESKEMLPLISELFIEARVRDEDVWKKLLDCFARMKMYRSLFRIFHHLSEFKSIISKKAIRSYWKLIFNQPIEELLRRVVESSKTSDFFSPSQSGFRNNKRKAIPEEIFHYQTKTQFEELNQPLRSSDGIKEHKDRFFGLQMDQIYLILDGMMNLLPKCPVLEELDLHSQVLKLHKISKSISPRFPQLSEKINKLQVCFAFQIPSPDIRGQVFRRMIEEQLYLPILDEVQAALSMSLNDELEEQMVEDGDLLLAQSVFDGIDQNKDYMYIFLESNGEYKGAFLEYMASVRRIENVLVFMLRHEKLNDTKKFLHHCYELHPDLFSDSCDGSLLDKFLEKNPQTKAKLPEN